MQLNKGKRHEKYLLAFYNRVNTNQVERIEDIPFTALSFLISMPYISLIEPFVKEDLIKGVYAKTSKYSSYSLAKKYQVSRIVIRRFSSEMLLSKSRRKNNPVEPLINV